MGQSCISQLINRHFTHQLDEVYAEEKRIFEETGNKVNLLYEDKIKKVNEEKLSAESAAEMLEGAYNCERKALPLEKKIRQAAATAQDYPSVYELFKYKTVDVLLKDYKSGKVLTDMKGLEFPLQYSQQACDIIAGKYFRKAGLPPEISESGAETSIRNVFDRMAGFWVLRLKDENFIDDQEAVILYDELVFALLSQCFAPNSPQWFNTGLYEAYGITGGDSGLFYYDAEKGEVVKSPDSYSHTQASACFILSIEDKLLGPNSISDHYVTETRLFKGGSGTGTNFSPIRAEGEALSSGGKSSGLMSFLRGLDRNAGAIKSGGTTRRAAKMVCLDIDHPEIREFINWKAHEEDKVVALSKMGYDADIDGEAYQTVSGQNSNNSVRFSDEFMQKVDNLQNDPDAEILLKGRVDDSVSKRAKVKDLWSDFNESAWRCADPAPQFSDTFNAWHTCPAGLDGQYGAPHNRLNSTNPCGEYAFLDNTACNLASINLMAFYDAATGNYDLQSLVRLISYAQLILESSIIGGAFPTEEIAYNSYMFRTTGLGYTNVGSILMAYGLPYDSNAARNMIAGFAALLTGQSYLTSAIMAQKAGAFEGYKVNAEYMLRVIRNHSRAAGVRNDDFEGINYKINRLDEDLLKEVNLGELFAEVKRAWQAAEELGEEYGYRNAQVTVMAPTGTISFAMDCASTGIEPFFSHVVYKKLSGGGYMKLSNPMIEMGLKARGYSKEEIDKILDYIMREEDGYLIDGKIEGAPGLQEEDLPVFDTAMSCGSGKRFIDPSGHVKMVAAITPLISGAVSKTVNLPGSADIKDFADTVLDSWKTGVKGISLYRDGSKAAQPLNISLQSSGKRKLKDLNYNELLEKAEAMEYELKDFETTRQAQDEHVSKLINALDDSYKTIEDLEEGIVAGNEGLSAKAGQKHPPATREKLRGIRSGRTHPAKVQDVKIYCTVNRDEAGEISEIYITTDREGSIIMGLLNSISKMVSVMLQYKIPAKNIAKMLRGQKFEPAGLVMRHPYIKTCSSISDLIAKIIELETGDYRRLQIKPGPEFTREIVSPAQVQPDYATNYGQAGDGARKPGEDFKARTGDSLVTGSGTGTAAELLSQEEMEVAKQNSSEIADDFFEDAYPVYDGSICSNCSSSRMVINGSCKVCLDCGSTTGCS